MADRCDDCGYPVRLHVAADGKPLGCPAVPSAQLGHHDARPRVTIRVCKSGARKGRVLAAWPDCFDRDTGQVLVWDLGTGDQFMEDQRALQCSTRKPTRDQEHDAIAEIEYQLNGDKVQHVKSVYARRIEE